jgi:hypothetical protein
VPIEAIESEKILAQVEQLLLKGFTAKKTIAKIVGVDAKTVSRYIERIQKRWAITGDKDAQRTAIGEYLEKSKMVEREAWMVHQNNVSDSIKLNALNLVLTCQRNQMLLLGLTSESINILIDKSQHNDIYVLGQQEQERMNRYAHYYLEATDAEIVEDE